MFHWIKRSPQAEHQFCQENLSPFLDRQLTPREQTRVTSHLQECPDCRADLQSLRQTVAVLRAVPAVKPPRTFFIPASEGVRKRQVQRNLLAYGYLQFATAVTTVLLVLVVSGDALLRLGVATSARQMKAPNVEITATGRGGEMPEAMPTTAAAAELQTTVPAPGAFGAVPPSPAELTAVTMLAQAPVPGEASQTETAQAVADSQALTAKAVPSQTFARPAGAPPLPTGTQESEVPPPPAAETGQPELTATLQAGLTAEPATPTPAPTQTAVPPTATPVPTETPVPPTATPVPPAEQPSPQPAHVELQPQELPPPAPAGRLGFLQGVQPLLPWLEWTLGALVAVLLVATLWLRRKQRTA
jgi:hypothetical protein